MGSIKFSTRAGILREKNSLRMCVGFRKHCVIITTYEIIFTIISWGLAMAVRRKSIEKSAMKTLSVEVDVGNWIEQTAGLIDDAAAQRIADGEDFDEVIEEATGYHPESNDSIFPGKYLLDFGDYETVLEELESDGISCTIDGEAIPFDIVVLPISEGAEWCASGWDEDESGPTEATLSVLGAASKDVLKLRDQHAAMRDKAISEFYSTSPNLWAMSVCWKGCSFSAESSVNASEKPNVAVVFFLQDYVLPACDEYINDDGDAETFRLSSSENGLYLAAIIANGKILDLNLTDDHDSDQERILVNFVPGEGCFLKYWQ